MLASLHDGPEFEVIECDPGHDRLRAAMQVFERDVLEVLFEEKGYVGFPGEDVGLCAGRKDGVDDVLPNIAATTVLFAGHSVCPGRFAGPKGRDFSLQCPGWTHRTGSLK